MTENQIHDMNKRNNKNNNNNSNNNNNNNKISFFLSFPAPCINLNFYFPTSL